MGQCRSYLPSDGSFSMPSILECASARDLTGRALDAERQDEAGRELLRIVDLIAAALMSITDGLAYSASLLKNSGELYVRWLTPLIRRGGRLSAKQADSLRIHLPRDVLFSVRLR